MFVKMPDENRLVCFWVAPAIIGGAMVASSLIGASSKGKENKGSSSVKLEPPNQTEQAIAGQFGSLFEPTTTYETAEISPAVVNKLMEKAKNGDLTQDEFMMLFGDKQGGKFFLSTIIPTYSGEYDGAQFMSPIDAWALYKSNPTSFMQKFGQYAKSMEDLPATYETTATIKPPQYDIGQSVADYQGQIQGAADTYAQGATSIWNDWMDFESQYDDIYQAIGPAYDKINQNYTQQLAALPKFNLGLTGGGSVPLAPKVHSNMYSNEAQTQAGLQNQKFGQQMQATSGGGQGIANRQNLLSNYYNVQSDAAQANLIPVELGKWLLQSERNLRAGAPQTQTTTGNTSNIASTMLPAIAMSTPAMINAFSGNTGQQTPQYQNPYYIPSPNQQQYVPGAWG